MGVFGLNKKLIGSWTKLGDVAKRGVLHLVGAARV